MDSPSNGGRDSRFTLANYEMPEMPMLSDAAEMYAGGILHNRPSITSGLCRPVSGNSCGSGQQRGLKRASGEMCYEGLSGRSSQMLAGGGGGAGADVDVEDKYSPSHPKNSPLSNGKKTKGRVKIKMEYIDNKLRRYTTFSKRKTGIMKKAYELSTLTGTQVMLLVASETGHVYTFATRKLQPMITSEAGKALIQTCLNSPDPCPSGSGDQRMSATGFEETELSYNIGDDEKVDSSSCSPYRSDSSDSSDVESVSGSPSSPPPLISLQDFQSSSAAAATASAPATATAASAAAVTRTESRGRGGSVTNQSGKKSSQCVTNQVKSEVDDECNSNISSSAGGNVRNSASMDTCGSSGGLGFTIAPTTSPSVANVNVSELLSKHTTPSGIVFTLEQLQREFGIHTTPSASGMQQFITIPLLGGGIPAVGNTADPPAAHQTPADLSNRSRK